MIICKGFDKQIQGRSDKQIQGIRSDRVPEEL